MHTYKVQLATVKMVIEAKSKEEALQKAREYDDNVQLKDVIYEGRK